MTSGAAAILSLMNLNKEGREGADGRGESLKLTQSASFGSGRLDQKMKHMDIYRYMFSIKKNALLIC